MIMTMMMAKHSCVLLPLLAVDRPRSCDQCEGSNISSVAGQPGTITVSQHVEVLQCVYSTAVC